jgi:hypothetical protein
LTRQLSVATLGRMFRRFFSMPTDDARDQMDQSPASAPPPSGEPDLATLPIVGITRRRTAILLGVLLAGWVIILFARQVSDASAATGRAEAMIVANTTKRTELAGLERELERIQQQRFIVQQARGYGLGGPKEIAFTLEAGAPPLDANAPGSAGLRVGAHTSVSPLDSWLTALFGPSR